jgi:hypothetical protein
VVRGRSEACDLGVTGGLMTDFRERTSPPVALVCTAIELALLAVG